MTGEHAATRYMRQTKKGWVGMSRNHYFLVSYRLGKQKKSTEVQMGASVLTPEQARYHIESLHSSELPSEITDIEVKPLGDSSEQEPGQQRQT